VSSSWVTNWTLLDLFVVLIVAMAVGRLWRWRWGLVALVTLALTYPESMAPRWLWLAVLAGDALVRALPAGRPLGYAKLFRLGAIVALVMIALGFAADQLRVGLYPQLAAPPPAAETFTGIGGAAPAAPAAEGRGSDELGLESAEKGNSQDVGQAKSFLPAFRAGHGAAGGARAEFPSPELLGELQKRLLERPECAPECASSPRLRLEVTRGALSARVEIVAATETAVPLPGSARHWSPTRVLVDGQPAQGLWRAPDGILWLEAAAGTHQVLLEGPLPDVDRVEMPLPLKPRRVEAHAEGWTVEGLREDG